ncbi:hypothetical protein [Candidatus Viadribacter manganicus]|uniref:Curlin n=1 Tax=Candidatus Viadribacter manganicus TaxID=1759059 RepID=A0A1B1ADW6_9PROT|nr:hypothetical protein [Candidatus Viadribacter manganicus]ANP44744.1 hypothetical protein ATE48_01800 [Candidatus Viadribacter manganicus]
MKRPSLTIPALALCFAALLAGAASAQGMGSRNIYNAAIVNQSGTGHAAAVVQAGQGNSAALGQAGARNAGAITQNGNNNAACLYQHGRDLTGSIDQYGDGATTAYIQTRSGLRPVPMAVCVAQVAGANPRDIALSQRTRPRR